MRAFRRVSRKARTMKTGGLRTGRWIMAGVLAAAGVWGANQPEKPHRVLCVVETPETQAVTYYNGMGAYLFTLERYLSPQRLLTEDFAVTQVGWLQAGTELDRVESYDAVLLWDVPTAIKDSRGTDPYYSDLTILSETRAARLVQFVENGGALIMAGGVTCYGNGHKRLGSADARLGNHRRYIGYATSPLAAILPVEIPDGETLRALARRTPTPQRCRIATPDPMVDGLDFNAWPFDAYHAVKAKEGAETLVTTEDGQPLVVRWNVKTGRVVCIMASPRGNILFPETGRASNPVWPEETVLWDRVMRWALNLDFPNVPRETEALAAYSAILNPPPRLPQEWLHDRFPYLAHVLDEAMPLEIRDLAFRYYHDLGFVGIVMQGGSRAPGMRAFLEDYARGLAANNLYAFLHPDPAVTVRRHIANPEAYAQKVEPSGALAQLYGSPSPCPYNPEVVAAAVDDLKSWVSLAEGLREIRGIFYDDEWAWVLGYRHAYEKQPGIGSYSPWVNAYYRAITGREAPRPVYQEPGYVAPEDDPWLHWCRTIRQDAFRNYNRATRDAVRSLRSDFLLSNYPGGMEGNLDVLIEEVYLDCWRESELEAIERMDVRANFREDAHRTRIPVWALIGIFRMPEDKAMYPESLRLTVGACLGSGAKGIILWNAVNLWAPYMHHPGRDSLDLEAARLGQLLHRFGPMFLALEKEPSDLWMLSGWFWVNSFDNYFLVPPNPEGGPNPERTWWPIQISDVAGPAALRAGLYTEFVTEKQLLSPDLFHKRAVLLPGLQYCRQAVVDNLEAFIRQGGAVFVDQSTRVAISGAKILPVDFSAWVAEIGAGKRPIAQPTEALYRQQRARRESYVESAIPLLREAVAPVVQPRVTLTHPDAAHTLMRHGASRYLFLYNSNTDRENTFDVRIRNLPGVVYDPLGGQRIATTPDGEGYRFAVALPPGGWKVLVLTPEPVAHLQVSVAERQGNTLRLQVEVRGESGSPVSAAVPLEIAVQTPMGTIPLYQAATLGILDVSIPTADALKDPQTITIRELLAGHEQTAPIQP